MSPMKQVLLYVCSIHTILAGTHGDADTLLMDLFTGYNTELRPVKDQSRAVELHTDLALVSINNFDEIAGVITVTYNLFVTWEDENLVWDPQLYGNLTYLTISQNKIWNPNLFSVDPTTASAPMGNGNLKVTITATGQVRWQLGGILRGTCVPYIGKFPFGQQACSMKIFPMGYSRAQLLVASSTFQLDIFRQSREYNLLRTQTLMITIVTASITEYHLIIERRPLHFLMSLVFPVIMLGLVNPLVFILPFTSGERSSFSITMLLAFTVYMTVVSDKMPDSSDPVSYLSYYILILLVISTLIVTANVFQIRMYGKDDEQEPVPVWICKFVVVLRKIGNRRKVDPGKRSGAKDFLTGHQNKTLQLESVDGAESVVKPASGQEEDIPNVGNITVGPASTAGG